mmetsp:Transcript_81722/g.243686  ORF Transcript_81722/g.243686 Transcript_81722/m.243686 type:complete len:483 (+) Transcript_81722:74-1522(+)
MPTAIKLSGRVGRHNLINDTYEPMQISHNGKQCWVARAVAPRYIFHTGKSRWCISKQLDDGARCWAFVSAPEGSLDPSACPGPWTCCDTDGEWRPDAAVSCEAVPACTDKFVQLRMSLDADMRQYGLIDHSILKGLWRKLDYNGNGIVSLAEIDKLVVEMVEGGSWPSWLNNKPALMRAYKKTILKDGDGDDWVQQSEFHELLLNIFWFNKLWQVFQVMDSGADRRIDAREFQAGMGQLGLHLTDQEAMQEFNRIDSNHGGQVLFVEFCAYIRKRVNPDASPNFDADIMSGEKCGQSLRRHSGNKATAEHFISKKCLKDFDDLEAKIKALEKDEKRLRELWDRLDYNGNGIVSLAEIDKLVVECFPLLNHKPALMRAYKKTISSGNRDDWVERKEFKAMLANVFYFNKLYWIFDEVNGEDRRITFPEFKKCLTLCGVHASQVEARHDFSQIDRNGGGMILFDEFCAWFSSKACPEALSAMVE